MKKNSFYITLLLIFVFFTQNAQALTSAATWKMTISATQILVLNPLSNTVNTAQAGASDTHYISGTADIQAQSNGASGYHVSVAPTSGAGVSGSYFVFTENGGADTVNFKIAKNVAVGSQGWQNAAPATLYGQSEKIIDNNSQTLPVQNVPVSFVVAKADVTGVSAGLYGLDLTATLTDYP